jgi:hypothetical protein
MTDARLTHPVHAFEPPLPCRPIGAGQLGGAVYAAPSFYSRAIGAHAAGGFKHTLAIWVSRFLEWWAR